MKRFLLDSNALSNFAYRQKDVYDRAMNVRKTGAIIGTAMPVVAETWGGALYSQSWQKNIPKIETALARLTIWPFDWISAKEYARLYAELRRSGIALQTIDRMIAAVALTLPSCTVVTCDSDFSRVPGLKIENWQA